MCRSKLLGDVTSDLDPESRGYRSAEYPRGFVGGTTHSEHCFFPQVEHRILFSTSANFASHPHNRPSVCGSAVRS